MLCIILYVKQYQRNIQTQPYLSISASMKTTIAGVGAD